MHFSTASIVLAAASIVSAAPAAPAAPALNNRTAQINDGVILNYALTLEHLEDTFYREGLAHFSQKDFYDAGYDSTFFNNIVTIAGDEKTHVNFLTAALKAAKVTPVEECKYNFGVTDIRSFIITAAILEGVGISAYLGAAAEILDKIILTDAASILSVEARHSSIIRSSLKEVPFPQPFDTPLSFDEVFSIASAFIVSCPSSNPTLPFKAFPKLTVKATNSSSIKTGDTITLTVASDNISFKATQGEKVFVAFIALAGPTFVEAQPIFGGYSVKIPDGFAGETFIVLNKNNTVVSDDTVIAGPAIIEISS